MSVEIAVHKTGKRVVYGSFLTRIANKGVCTFVVHTPLL